MSKRFNVSIQWNDLDFKLLSVYDISYFKCFVGQVECALYEASIEINNKIRLSRDRAIIMDEYSAYMESGKRTTNEHLSLKVTETGDDRFKHWRIIEIHMSESEFLGEKIYWRSIELITRMQRLRPYCLQ